MVTFADTSGLYAILDTANVAHEFAAGAWAELRRTKQEVVTTNYVLVEAAALLQGRLGVESVRGLIRSIVPVLTVEWVTWETHEVAVAALLAANRRDLSLVDCVSFETMRRLGLRHAFTLDPHFREQGFDCVP